MIKTRSKLTLPDFNYDVLGVSPLKQARTARRTTDSHPCASNTTNGGGEVDGDEEEIDPKHPKRSSATFGLGGIPNERESKRVKRVPLECGAQDDPDTVRTVAAVPDADEPVASSSRIVTSRKPSSTVSLPPSATEQQGERTPRSQSVPAQRAFPSATAHRTPRRIHSPSRRPQPGGTGIQVTVTASSTDEDVTMASPHASPRTTPGPSNPYPDPSIPSSPLTPAPITPAPLHVLPSARDSGPDAMAVSSETIETDTTTTPRADTTRPIASIVIPAVFDFPFDAAANTPNTPTPKRKLISRMKPKGAKTTPTSAPSSDLRTAEAPSATNSTSKRAKTFLPETNNSKERKTPVNAVSIEEVMHESTSKHPPLPTRTQVGGMKRNTTSVPMGDVILSSPTKKSILLEGSIDIQVPLNDAHEDEDEVTPNSKGNGRAYTPLVNEKSTPAALEQPPSASEGTEGAAKTMAVNRKSTSESAKETPSSVPKEEKSAPLPATASAKGDNSRKLPPSRSTKPSRAMSEIPLGGRMTRSASLRQKETKKNMDTAATGTTVERGRTATRASESRSGETNARASTSTSMNARSKTPAPSVRARSKTPGPSTTSTSAAPSQTQTQTEHAPPTTPGRKRATSLSSVARPTLSSTAKTLPPTTPGKTPGRVRTTSRPPASTIGIPASSMSKGTSDTSRSSSSSGTGMTRSHGATNLNFSRPPNSESAASGTGLKRLSSLSTLSLALQRLHTTNAGRSRSVGIGLLERPSTSLGFTRDLSGSDDEDGDSGANGKASGKVREVTRGSKGKSKDDTHIPRSSVDSTSDSPSVVAKITNQRDGSAEPDTSTSGRQVKRAATVGPSAYVGVRQEHGKGIDKAQRTLMLPPPVPKRARESDTDDTDGERSTKGGSNAGLSTGAGGERKRINVHSGMVAGSARGRGRGGSAFGSTGGGAKPTFGIARLAGLGTSAGARGAGAGRGVGGSRVLHRVSKQSSLPTVEGSPVKPLAEHDEDVVMADAANEAETEEEDPLARKDKGKARAQDGPAASTATAAVTGPSRTFDIEAIRTLVREEVAAEDAAAAALASVDDNGPSSPEKWRMNATRRASAASHFLSQSMSNLPQTPVRTKGKARAMNTVAGGSKAFPQTSVSLPALGTAPGALGGGVGARVSANTRGMAAAVAAAAASPVSDAGADGEKGKDKETAAGAGTPESETKPGTGGAVSSRQLKILKNCRIFVDVRTDDGDDAGALFVDMLQKLGAKLLARVSQSCTHIVFKNGLMSTISRYRAAAEPKPLVVGIAWVVECAEQAKHADETKFLISLDGVNVAGANKRRRSMLPKHLTDFGETPVLSQTPSGESSKDSSMEMNSPSSDDAAGNSSLDSDLPPLERARRRHSSLFATWGQGR